MKEGIAPLESIIPQPTELEKELPGELAHEIVLFAGLAEYRRKKIEREKMIVNLENHEGKKPDQPGVNAANTSLSNTSRHRGK